MRVLFLLALFIAQSVTTNGQQSSDEIAKLVAEKYVEGQKWSGDFNN